ncbi:MAG: flagellar basal body P-ring formation protein FlgA [Legionella sp.]|nr:flagellar basal body P-ring formation protein FlgA [Legionella sp.]
MVKKSILIGLFIFASTQVLAEEIQSPELLTKKIENYIYQELSHRHEGKLHVSADKIDSKLSLKVCAEEQLIVFNPYATPLSEASTMGIRCQEPDNRWSLYVPVRISLMKTIYIASRTMHKGETITGSDLVQAEMDVHKLKNGYFDDIDKLIGRACKNTIPVNSAFNPQNIELAKVIHKGERVKITTTNNTLSISMDGLAMNDGAIGDSISVRNLTSNKVLEAQVAGEKQVTVIF